MSESDEEAARQALREQLHSSGSLHGRGAQSKQLVEAYETAVLKKDEGQPQRLILVSGDAGTGKSSLVMNFQQQIRDKTIILQGKFDQFQESQDTIAAAFAQINEFLKTDQNIKERVQQAVGPDANLLVQTIPDLAGVLTVPFITGEGLEESTEDVAATKARKRSTFLRFVSAICSPSKPVMLFIDDLQWASNADFELLSSILLEEKISGLVVVGACRSVAKDHPLSIFLEGLSSRIEIQDITVSNLSLEAVTEYLSELCCWQDCRTLADAMYLRTAGNPFFVKAILSDLLEERRLVWQEGFWTWSVEDVELQESGEGILLFIAEKLRHQPSDMQDLLKAAACLGATFGIDLLQYLVKPNKEQRLDALLCQGQRNGALVRKSSASSIWSFAHDRIQQASYSLIPQADRVAFHLFIGRTFRDRMTEEQLEASLSLVASQFISGTNLIADHEERIHTATLLLRAGKQQATMSKFDGARKFFSVGLALLDDDCWSACYQLSLELHNAQAEVCYVLAEFERLDALSDILCRHAMSFDDTIQMHTTHVYSLGARNMLQDAIDEGLVVLENLGEPLPRSISFARILIEYLKTNQKLSHLSERKLLNLPRMTKPKKLAALRLLNLLFSYMFWKGDEKRRFFLTIRSVQLTLNYGVCGMSALGLANYSSFFCSLGKFEKGFRLGNLAVSVMERFKTKEWAGRVLTVVASFVDPWKVQPRDLTAHFETAYQSCFETGDIEFALLSRSLLIGNLFMSTEIDLDYVLKQCETLNDQLHRYKQEALLVIIGPTMQAIANFAGQSEDPTILTGAFMNEAELTSRFTTEQDNIALLMLLLFKTTLGVFVCDFDLACEQLHKFKRLKHKTVLSPAMMLMELYYGGIALLSVERPCVRTVKANVRRLRGINRHAPCLFTNKICLLEAELAAVQGNTRTALEKFGMSIALSQRQSLLHDQALACERASFFLKKLGREAEATMYLDEARTLYQKWGCLAKIRHIDGITLKQAKGKK